MLSYFTRSSHSAASRQASVRLLWKVDNPAIVFRSAPESPSCIILNGALELHVNEDSIDVVTIHGGLDQHSVFKRPAHTSCEDCRHHRVILKDWSFLNRLQRLTRGVHSFPFSCPLDERLPVSLDTALYSTSYELNAEARFAHAGRSSITNVSAEREVTIGCASVQLPPPLSSITNHRSGPIDVALRYSNTIDPTKPNTVAIRGATASEAEDTWALTRVTWKMIQKARVSPLACKRHTSSSQEPARSSIQTLAEGEMCGEWAVDGQRQEDSLQFEYTLNGEHRGAQEGGFACSSSCDGGGRAQVSHTLAVSMLFRRKSQPPKDSRAADSSIGSRIIQVQIAVCLARYPLHSEDYAAGVAPAYGDVEPSPPSYLS